MMNYIWAGMLVLSFLAACFQGTMPELSEAVIASGGEAVSLCIKLLGMLCLWGGLMEIAVRSGLTKHIARVIGILIRPVFPKLKKDGEAVQAMSMNITANLLGLGNAATPLGISAMKALKVEEGCTDTASDNMVNFVVMNSAALHLVPTTVAMLRASYGSGAPMDILPAAILTSFAALAAGLAAAKVLGALSRRRQTRRTAEVEE